MVNIGRPGCAPCVGAGRFQQDLLPASHPKHFQEEISCSAFPAAMQPSAAPPAQHICGHPGKSFPHHHSAGLALSGSSETSLASNLVVVERVLSLLDLGREEQMTANCRALPNSRVASAWRAGAERALSSELSTPGFSCTPPTQLIPF